MTSKHDDQETIDQQRWKIVEWLIAGVAGLAIIGMFGFLSIEALTSTDAPPLLSLRALSVREDQGLHYLTVSVTNSGGEAAADASVKGTITDKGDERSASATIDYVPANSSGEVTLIFAEPFDEALLELSIEGFRSP